VLKGFREFLVRGNVIDLAVGVVIGVAFTAIVTAFADSIIKPLINSVTPSDSPGLGFTIVAGKPSTYVDVAALITAALDFLIVAAVVYFVFVLPMNKLRERPPPDAEQTPAEPTEVELLADIRDLLRSKDDGVRRD
jgi:large conductance mechanosensitive channel